MLPENFVYVSLLLNLIAGVSYFLSTWRGDTQPNRVTWFFWALAPLIAGAGQLSEGVGLATLAVFSISIPPILILLASFWNEKAYWKLGPFDYACGAAALFGLLLWAITNDALYAILFAIASDLFAAIPTLLKSYTDPQSEDGRAFVLGTIAPLIGLLVVQESVFAGYAFLTYSVLINGAIVALIYRKRIRGQ